MQSIFRLPWCSDTLGANRPDHVAIQKMRHAPTMEIPVFSTLKRKRTGSPESMRLPGEKTNDAKRMRTVEPVSAIGKHEGDWQPEKASASGGLENPRTSSVNTNQAPTSFQSSQPDTVMSEPTETNKASCQTDNAARSALQKTIEHQFNLEILLKHRELRLIEQELAKCQVALEQLRRCEMVPFPGVSSLSENVSTGTGPALRSDPTLSQPSAPAPWGVTDGPYSRHYAKWLLPDGTFDPMSMAQQAAIHDSFASRSEGRATRNSGAGLPKAGKRTNRESLGSTAQASPNHPAATLRNKQGPLVIRRVADNQFVKLVCKHCHRSDFSSVQGFLNHCRIAHKTDYKSHEAAAQDCGRPLEEHEADLAAQAPPPVGTASRTAAPKQAVPAPIVGRVHALNQSQPPPPTWKRQRLAHAHNLKAQTQSPARSTIAKTTVSSATSSWHSSPLVPSTMTPYLSAQFAKHGLGGNLQAATAKAKEKIDLSSEEDADDGQDSEAKSLPIEETRPALARTVSGAGHLVAERPPSRKGHRQPLQRPRPAPLSSCLQSQQFRSEIPESPQDVTLSPHTADSNPGLVSDHDDDPVSEPDEEARSVIETAPPLPLSRSCGNEMEVDLEVEDNDEGHSVLIRPRSMIAHGQERLRNEGSPSRPRSRYGEGGK